MNAIVYSKDGKQKGELQLPDEVFGCEVNVPLLHQIVTLYQANLRQGTSKTKTRAEVSGGGKKPWKQKGTGHARSGSNTSPVWVRGGKAFGPSPRDYSSVIPPKMRKVALCSALSARAKENSVVVFEEISLTAPKTKMLSSVLKSAELISNRNLLVIDDSNANVYLSGRNIKNLVIKKYSDINSYDVIRAKKIIFGTQQIVEKMKEVVAL